MTEFEQQIVQNLKGIQEVLGFIAVEFFSALLSVLFLLWIKERK
jgi:hypothetical protein